MNRFAVPAKLAAVMLLGAQLGFALRSKEAAKSNVVAMEVPLHQSKSNGIDVDTVLVSDLSTGSFKETRAEWKVESDGASTPSLEGENPQTIIVPQTTTQDSNALLHRWRTDEIMNYRSVHVAFAVVMVMLLLAACSMSLYWVAGGTWKRKYAGLSVSEAAEVTPLRTETPPEKNAEIEAAAFFTKKMQDRLDRFEDRPKLAFFAHQAIASVKGWLIPTCRRPTLRTLDRGVRCSSPNSMGKMGRAATRAPRTCTRKWLRSALWTVCRGASNTRWSRFLKIGQLCNASVTIHENALQK